jgi:hypothetical protein
MPFSRACRRTTCCAASKLRAGYDRRVVLRDAVPRAFAPVSVAAKRVVGKRLLKHQFARIRFVGDDSSDGRVRPFFPPRGRGYPARSVPGRWPNTPSPPEPRQRRIGSLPLPVRV